MFAQILRAGLFLLLLLFLALATTAALSNLHESRRKNIYVAIDPWIPDIIDVALPERFDPFEQKIRHCALPVWILR